MLINEGSGLTTPARALIFLRALLTLMILALVGALAPPRATAASCAATIASCGCSIDAAGVFVTSGPLSSASLSADCVDITAAGAVLVLAGDITGPGGAVTADGIHVMSSAANAFIVGNTTFGFDSQHTVSGFATGIQVDAANVEIDLLNAKQNTGNAVFFNNVSGGDYDDASADTNGAAGVMVQGGAEDLVADSDGDSNGANGVVFALSGDARIVDSAGDTNTGYGFWIDQSADGQIKDSGTTSNTGTGTYIGCAATGGPIGKKCKKTKPAEFNRVIFSGGSSNGGASVGLEKGTTFSVLDGNGGTSNATFDLVDDNAKCDHNVWFANVSATTSQSCIGLVTGEKEGRR